MTRRNIQNWATCVAFWCCLCAIGLQVTSSDAAACRSEGVSFVKRLVDKLWPK